MSANKPPILTDIGVCVKTVSAGGGVGTRFSSTTRLMLQSYAVVGQPRGDVAQILYIVGLNNFLSAVPGRTNGYASPPIVGFGRKAGAPYVENSE